MGPSDVLALIEKKHLRMVDLKFMDFPGMWQHFSVPVSEFSVESFEEGFGFDGSSIRGWQPIHASDMLVIPDPATAQIDPFIKTPTLSLICDIADSVTREKYTRDPRNIASKAESYLKASGAGDTAHFGPEPEFFIFDDIRYESTRNSAFYHIESVEGHWNTRRDEHPNLGYKPRYKEGYFPVPPTDSLVDIRNEMVEELQKLGIIVEAQHHEAATAGQSEIDIRFNRLREAGDQLQWFKYVIKNVAYRHGRTVTFMPKPIYEDNGSGMHVHISIWKNGNNIFAGDQYAGLSKEALFFIGGILAHARSLNAFTNPTTNSYRRLVPGYEAPVNLAYSSRNRSASVRIPMGSVNPKSRRVEIRFPDPSANGYLAFAALLMAGLDGMENQIDPGEPLDKDIYSMSPLELHGVPSTCGSLSEALHELEQDQEYLLKGDVFTPDVIETWLEYKRKREVDEVRRRPVPMEFQLYYDI